MRSLLSCLLPPPPPKAPDGALDRWVGQTVGALNYKYFVNFTVQWAPAYCVYILVTLALFVDLDGQIIAVLALAAVFAFSTVLMSLAHLRLVLLNLTTIEAAHVSDRRRRERLRLIDMHGHGNLRAKWHTQRQWDQDWGRCALLGSTNAHRRG